MTTADDVVVESPFTSLIKVQHAGSKGRGLFAKAFIPKGTLIGNIHSNSIFSVFIIE